MYIQHKIVDLCCIFLGLLYKLSLTWAILEGNWTAYITWVNKNLSYITSIWLLTTTLRAGL